MWRLLRAGRVRALLVCLAGFALLLLPGTQPGFAAEVGAARPLPETQATFVMHFVAFTTWPDETEAQPKPRRLIGVIGDDFGAIALEDLAAKRPPANATRLEVRRVRQTDDLQGCDVVLLGDGYDEEKWNPVLAGLRDKPVLTIGVGRVFAQRRGIIGIILEKNRMRFAINLGRSKAAGLRLSSHMLRLAEIVGE